MTDTGEPFRARTIAEGFGADADAYDRFRPRYPRVFAERVLEGLPAPARAVDVGIGTGLSSLPFRDAGCRVLGVEVDERMAEVARRRGFEVEVARFEEWDAAARTFDLVIAGQTWHWVDPAAGAAKAHDVLEPGGRIAVFWNAGDPAPEIAAGFAEAYRSVETGLPFTPWSAPQREGYAAFLDAAADGIRASAGFDEPERVRVDWQAVITRDDWLAQVPTSGGHNRIAPEKLDALLAAMGAVIDRAGGEFTMEYATLGVLARRRAADQGR
ncbi:class I SAM-dependent methyltransferase [Microbacterium protaetiae]|uniref:Class I SAM-dependent methyltransferase n=1 Tax=Microbacterium protaetiae TaxID=2509458 RepID=A0A4P6EFI0_9MICO|nr:class I SAM-dependent methyltransferase [Microbacterium protaetiae]QAY60566.1 class I SAM-dependent methyltransferase [Microbacterium protaetiae]